MTALTSPRWTPPAVALLLLAALAGAPACREREEAAPAPPSGTEVSPFAGPAAAPSAPPTGPRYADVDLELEVGAPRPCPLNAPFLPAPGFVRLSVPVRVQSRSARSVPTSALAFSLRDRDGQVFGATLAGCDPVLLSQRLSGGAVLEGHVAFDVPSAATRLELAFEPFIIGRPEVRARALVPAVSAPTRP